MAESATAAKTQQILTTASNAIDAPALTQRNIGARSKVSYVTSTRMDCARKSCDRQRNKRNAIAQNGSKLTIPA